MALIGNFDSLSIAPERKIVLEIIESGLEAIQPQKVLKTSLVLTGSILSVGRENFELNKYKRVFLIGFGKGSAGIAKVVEKKLGERLTEGYVIDNVEQKFRKLNFTLGTHPLPSRENIDFTKNVLEKIKNLTAEDLVIVVICGGGSAMFEAPYRTELEELIKIFQELLRSGATISEMNVIRKHLSRVKGGGLAKHLYPATVVSLIFSDVPGSDLSTIASAPTVKNTTTVEDAIAIIKKYKVDVTREMLTQLPVEDKYFQNVHNIIVVSNKTALEAMKKKALRLGFQTDLFSDRLQGEARNVGEKLISVAKPGRVLLAGGETTMKVSGKGKGGRNQTLVLNALPFIKEGTVLASFDSDGVDFYHFAGAIADSLTVKKASRLKLDPKKYLSDDNSYGFFEKTGDGIYTGKLESNVSDLFVVFKK